ncbi:MAG: 2OG-Fe(II) oxygenase family protein [Pseudomonadota bacterium]
MIPEIPVRSVLSGSADGAILDAATDTGFFTLSGVDAACNTGAPREILMRLFDAPEHIKRPLLRHKYDPTHRNVYRGYFLPEPEKDALLEGIDLGPDVADATRAGDGRDPLTEPTPLPDLPGWAEAAGQYHKQMSQLGFAIASALFRTLGADPALADDLFGRGISTLRLFRYPEMDLRDVAPRRRLLGEPDRVLMTLPHTDSGFITLLWQDGIGGLQAEMTDGTWVDIPPAPDGLVVNFGQMLGDWSDGRIKATKHRVLAGPSERISVPFFFEPAVDAVLSPLDPSSGAEPFIYGDFLWSRMVNFPNFHGVVRQAVSS